MINDEIYHDLIATLYRAATHPELWPDTLERLAALWKGHAAFTMTVGSGAHQSEDLLIYNLPVVSFVLYGDYYYQHDLWSPPWIQNGMHELGKVYSGEQLIKRSAFLKSIWFNDFLKPFDIEHSLFASLSGLSPKPSILVCNGQVKQDTF